LMRGFKGILYRFGWGLRRVAVIGDIEEVGGVVQFLSERKSLGYKVVGKFVEFDKRIIKNLDELKIDELLFINPRADEKETLLAIVYCEENHKVFKLLAWCAMLSSAFAYKQSVARCRKPSTRANRSSRLLMPNWLPCWAAKH